MRLPNAIPTRTPGEIALQKLQLDENEPLRWFLGPILEKRACHEQWHCTPLVFLHEGNETSRQYWNEVIARFRQLLQNPSKAPQKALDELNPVATDFEQQLHDLLGEVISLLHLHKQGYPQFLVQLRIQGLSTPDFYAVSTDNAELIPVEFKNLRTTRSADAVLRDAFIERSGAARGKGMNVVLVNNPPTFVDEFEAEALRNWALNLQLKTGFHKFSLPDNQTVNVRVDDGIGDLRVEQYLSISELDEQTRQGLYKKAKRVIEENLRRKPFTSGAGKKMAVLRWCIPDDLLIWSDFLKKDLQQKLRAEYQSVDPELEIHIFTNWDHQESKPK